jgi:lipopolysaccharide biosynthesis glycosyltransferase
MSLIISAVICTHFNAGILVLNLNKWRANAFSNNAIKYFRQNLEYIGWYDQGILNALLVGKWGHLDPRWNFNVTSFYDSSSRSYLPWINSKSLLSEDVYNKLISSSYIVHFVSGNKPWICLKCPLREDFFEYVDRTKWSGWRITILRRLWRKLFPTRSKSIDWL